MSYEPTDPETVPVPVTTIESKVIGIFFIDNFKVELSATDINQTTLTVQWSKGYMDGQIFVATETTISAYKGPNLIAKLNELVTSNVSHYENIKIAIWELMEAEGTLPPGSIN